MDTTREEKLITENTPSAPQTFTERIRALFRRRPNVFLQRLLEQATLTVAALDVLLDYMKKPSEKNAQRVHRIEHDADEVRRILIDELNRTFVTPIDRQDIFALSRAIDDVVDYADSTIIEMEVLSVKPNNYLLQMTSLLRDAAEEIRLAMERLENHPAVANEHAAKAKSLENRMEGLYREAVADLFRNAKSVDHVVEMLKLREIYRHMSNAADRGDEAANVIGDIIVKST
jgi:predicted phosphate transport protein (TIGR00153 family)